MAIHLPFIVAADHRSMAIDEFVPAKLAAHIGPLSFVLESVRHEPLATLATRPLAVIDGEPVEVLDEGERTYLVLDHRRLHGELARIEHWAVDPAAGCPEGPVDGLLLLCDAAESCGR